MAVKLFFQSRQKRDRRAYRWSKYLDIYSSSYEKKSVLEEFHFSVKVNQIKCFCDIKLRLRDSLKSVK